MQIASERSKVRNQKLDPVAGKNIDKYWKILKNTEKKNKKKMQKNAKNAKKNAREC